MHLPSIIAHWPLHANQYDDDNGLFDLGGSGDTSEALDLKAYASSSGVWSKFGEAVLLGDYSTSSRTSATAHLKTRFTLRAHREPQTATVAAWVRLSWIDSADLAGIDAETAIIGLGTSSINRLELSVDPSTRRLRGKVAGTTSSSGCQWGDAYLDSGSDSVGVLPAGSAGVWSHVAMSYSGTHLQIFLNGQSVALRNCDGAGAGTSGGPLSQPTGGEGIHVYIGGKGLHRAALQEIYLFEKGLQLQEVRTVYERALTCVDGGGLVYYARSFEGRTDTYVHTPTRAVELGKALGWQNSAKYRWTNPSGSNQGTSDDAYQNLDLKSDVAAVEEGDALQLAGSFTFTAWFQARRWDQGGMPCAGDKDCVRAGAEADAKCPSSKTCDTFDPAVFVWSKAANGEGALSLEICPDDGSGNLIFRHGTTSNSFACELGCGRFHFNRWMHVTLVRDLTDTSIKWYLDGSLSGTCSAGTDMPVATPTSFFLGGNGGDSSRTDFRGTLHDVRFFGSALTEARLSKLLTTSSSPPATTCADLKRYQPLLRSGTYTVRAGTALAHSVYCDMSSQNDGGGWTLVHHEFGGPNADRDQLDDHLFSSVTFKDKDKDGKDRKRFIDELFTVPSMRSTIQELKGGRGGALVQSLAIKDSAGNPLPANAPKITSSSLYGTSEYLNILPLHGYAYLQGSDEIMFEYIDLCEEPEANNGVDCQSYYQSPLLSAAASHQRVVASGRFDQLGMDSSSFEGVDGRLNDASCVSVSGRELTGGARLVPSGGVVCFGMCKTSTQDFDGVALVYDTFRDTRR